MIFNFDIQTIDKNFEKEKWVFSIYNFHSSLGIHLLHQKLFRRLVSSSILSFKVLIIFLWSLRAEARAFLGALAFFLGSISYIMRKEWYKIIIDIWITLIIRVKYVFSCKNRNVCFQFLKQSSLFGPSFMTMYQVWSLPSKKKKNHLLLVPLFLEIGMTITHDTRMRDQNETTFLETKNKYGHIYKDKIYLTLTHNTTMSSYERQRQTIVVGLAIICVGSLILFLCLCLLWLLVNMRISKSW